MAWAKKDKGITRKQVGIEIDCKPLKGPNTSFWKIEKDNEDNKGWENQYFTTLLTY